MTLATIGTEAELDALLESSANRPVLIYKHSNACGVSTRGKGQVEQYLAGHPTPSFGFAMVVVQDARELSDAIEQRLGVRHETPQAIVVRGGKAVWTASHFDVTAARLKMALEGL